MSISRINIHFASSLKDPQGILTVGSRVPGKIALPTGLCRSPLRGALSIFKICGLGRGYPGYPVSARALCWFVELSGPSRWRLDPLTERQIRVDEASGILLI